MGLSRESISNSTLNKMDDSNIPSNSLFNSIPLICLLGNKEGTVDQLAFETLIPKSIIHRYLQLLLDHRRIILSGSSGTGKTYLAQKIADYLVAR